MKLRELIYDSSPSTDFLSLGKLTQSTLAKRSKKNTLFLAFNPNRIGQRPARLTEKDNVEFQVGSGIHRVQSDFTTLN